MLNKIEEHMLGFQNGFNSEKFIATEGQTVFTLTNGSYKIGKNRLTVYIHGIKQVSDAFTETSETSFTLSTGVPADTEVEAVWYESVLPATGGHNSNHHVGGVDEIDVTNLKNYQEQIATPLAETPTVIDLKKKYGAVGDGVADDSDAIQQAEDEASSSDGKAAVVFYGGNYRITKTINKSPKTRWIGVGNRYINSSYTERKSQGSRIVCDFDGDAIAITGYPVDGNGINQRGGIQGIQVYSDNVAYPNSRGVVVTNDAREHFMRDVLINGFNFSFHATNAKAFRFEEVYLTGAKTTGLFAEDCTDFLFFHSQVDGEVYGGHFKNCKGFTGTGARFQVSGTNLRLESCSLFSFTGGFNDTGNGIGLHLINTRYSQFANIVYYANGGTSPHVLVESTGTSTTSNLTITGVFHNGSTGTPKGIEFIRPDGSNMRDIIAGGDFSLTTPLTNTIAVTSGLRVLPSIGVASRIGSIGDNLLPDADNTRTLGSASLRYQRVTANEHNVYLNAGDSQPRSKLGSASLEFGAGGSTAPDTKIYRAAADLLRTDDDFDINVGKTLSLRSPDGSRWKINVDDTGAITTTKV